MVVVIFTVPSLEFNNRALICDCSLKLKVQYTRNTRASTAPLWRSRRRFEDSTYPIIRAGSAGRCAQPPSPPTRAAARVSGPRPSSVRVITSHSAVNHIFLCRLKTTINTDSLYLAHQSAARFSTDRSGLRCCSTPLNTSSRRAWAEALSVLDGLKEKKTQVLAGGTDLIPWLRGRVKDVDYLIDLADTGLDHILFDSDSRAKPESAPPVTFAALCEHPESS